MLESLSYIGKNTKSHFIGIHDTWLRIHIWKNGLIQ